MLTSSPQGLTFETTHFTMFFGNASFSRTNGQHLFPGLELQLMSQVHGNTSAFVEQPCSTTADALLTTNNKIALVVQTADCLPILVGNSYGVCAIHAGWRGLVAGVIASALHLLPHKEEGFACIGPHILAHSFEVGLDVRDQLVNCLKLYSPRPEDLNAFTHTAPHDSQKAFVDLQMLAKYQLQAFGLSPKNCFFANVDTLTQVDWHSFRRDKNRAGRNLSICFFKGVSHL